MNAPGTALLPPSEPALSRLLPHYADLRKRRGGAMPAALRTSLDATAAALLAEIERADSLDGRFAGDRVLLVDDEPAVLFLMAEFLDGEGCELLRARNGEEARQLLGDVGPVDAIVVDRVMPRMGGTDFLRWKGGDPRFAGIPAIFQTGADGDDEVIEGLDAGAAFYLVKPYDPLLFRAMVRVALAIARRKAAS